MKDIIARIKSDDGALGTTELIFLIGAVVVFAIIVIGMITSAGKTQAGNTADCIANPNGEKCKGWLAGQDLTG